jgi:hypothetical protein
MPYTSLRRTVQSEECLLAAEVFGQARKAEEGQEAEEARRQKKHGKPRKHEGPKKQKARPKKLGKLQKKHESTAEEARKAEETARKHGRPKKHERQKAEVARRAEGAEEARPYANSVRSFLSSVFGASSASPTSWLGNWPCKYGNPRGRPRSPLTRCRTLSFGSVKTTL